MSLSGAVCPEAPVRRRLVPDLGGRPGVRLNGGMERVVDYSPLLAQPTADEIRAYRARARRTGVSIASASSLVGAIAGVVGGIAVAAVALSTAAPVVVSAVRSGSPVGLGFAAVPILVVVIAAVVAVGAMAAPFDVEIVDRWMFVYHPRGFDMSSPAVIERLFRIARTVGAKTLDQSENYRDDRMPDARTADVVAPEGRRLRRGVSVGAIVTIALIAVAWEWGFVRDVVETLLGAVSP